MDKRQRARQIRKALSLYLATAVLEDSQILEVTEYLPTWVEEGYAYKQGSRFRYGTMADGRSQVYEVIQDVTSQPGQQPGGEGMLAIYRPIELEHTGAKEDPIPFVDGMDVHVDLYYSYESGLWQAKKDMLPCSWPPTTGNEWEQVTAAAE